MHGLMEVLQGSQRQGLQKHRDLSGVRSLGRVWYRRCRLGRRSHQENFRSASHSRLPARSLQDRRIRLQLEFKASIDNSRGRAGWRTLFWMAHRRKGLVGPAIEARSGDHALISVKRPGPDVAQVPNATVEMEWGECAARVAEFFLQREPPLRGNGDTLFLLKIRKYCLPFY